MKRVAIIGAGPAGIEAAANLANNNIDVTIIEKQNITGGNLNNWYQLFPDRKDASLIRKYLNNQLSNNNIKLIFGDSPKYITKNANEFHIKTNKGDDIISDAILIATGFDVFDAHIKEEYGYGIYNNVYTSVDIEKMFTYNKLHTSNGDIPKRIGIIHCVGSRDEKCGNFHCSKVCCITAVKQAIEIKEKYPNTEVFCFYMDMRMYGAGYEEMYREAQEKYGIIFIRGRLSESSETIDNKLQIKLEDTLVGKPLKMTIDMLILMVGIEPSVGTKSMVNILNLDTSFNKFIKTIDVHTSNNTTNQDAIFTAGTCTAPMNINDTLNDAKSASLEILKWFKSNNN